MSGLKISSTLTLPHDAVTQTFSILAMRGRGKSYTGSVMVEEMIEARLPVVVIDPVGVWWGLRSSADGKSEGYPVVIFGGKHADVPLEPTSGVLVADMLVADPFPCVIDLSGFDSKADEIRFMTDFLTRLYRTNSEPLHLMIDEADEFAPQQAFPEGKRLLGAMEQIVRRGRAKGLGCTLITQRPAVLNKNVLSQTETLILLGMTGVNDLKAVDEWVGKHSDDDAAKSIKGSLPGLPIGTAWVWSPSWLGITQQVKVRKRRTFDSSATPKVGGRKVEAREMAPVDLDVIRDKMAATIQRVEGDDPALLRREILRLKHELSQMVADTPPPERVEVPVFGDIDREIFEDAITNLTGFTDLLRQAVSHREPVVTPRVPPVSPAAPRPSALKPTATRPAATPGDDPGTLTLGKAHRSILTVLAQHGPLPKDKVALISGYKVGGGFNNALGALRTAGYVHRGDPIEISTEGLLALGPVEPLPTGQALIEHHARNLPKASREILSVLTSTHTSMTKEEIADATGYAVGGAFNNGLGRLRSLGLIVTENGLNRAVAELLTG